MAEFLRLSKTLSEFANVVKVRLHLTPQWSPQTVMSVLSGVSLCWIILGTNVMKVRLHLTPQWSHIECCDVCIKWSLSWAG